MKNIITIAFIFLSICLSAQRETVRFLNLSCNIQQVGLDSGKPLVSCNCLDQGGTYDSGDVMVGDSLFFNDSGIGYKMVIDDIPTPGAPTTVVRLDWTGLGLGLIPTGRGSITASAANGLDATVAGMTDADNQYLMEDFVERVGTGTGGTSIDSSMFSTKNQNGTWAVDTFSTGGNTLMKLETRSLFVTSQHTGSNPGYLRSNVAGWEMAARNNLDNNFVSRTGVNTTEAYLESRDTSTSTTYGKVTANEDGMEFSYRPGSGSTERFFNNTSGEWLFKSDSTVNGNPAVGQVLMVKELRPSNSVLLEVLPLPASIDSTHTWNDSAFIYVGVDSFFVGMDFGGDKSIYAGSDSLSQITTLVKMATDFATNEQNLYIGTFPYAPDINADGTESGVYISPNYWGGSGIVSGNAQINIADGLTNSKIDRVTPGGSLVGTSVRGSSSNNTNLAYNQSYSVSSDFADNMTSYNLSYADTAVVGGAALSGNYLYRDSSITVRAYYEGITKGRTSTKSATTIPGLSSVFNLDTSISYSLTKLFAGSNQSFDFIGVKMNRIDENSISFYEKYQFPNAQPSTTLNDTTLMAWRGNGTTADPIGFINKNLFGGGGGGTHPVALGSDVSGTLPVANGGTGVTTSTGTTNVVLSNSPTLVTPTFTTNATTPLLIGGTGTTSTLTYRTTTGVGATGARHIFQVGNNGATEAMTILNSGDVGIGTASTSEKLTVSGNIAATDVVLNGGYSVSGITLDGDATNPRILIGESGSRYGQIYWDKAPDELVFLAANGTFRFDQNTRFGAAVSISASAPASTAALDVSSTTKGALLPRMTNTQRDAIITPATGLLITSTTDGAGTQYYNGTTWMDNAYGYMSIVDSSFTLTTTGAGTFDWVTNATRTLWNNEKAYASVTVQGDSVIIGIAGEYEIGYDLSVTGGANAEYTTAVLVNGTPSTAGGKAYAGVTSTEPVDISGKVILTLAATNVVKLGVERTATATNPTIVHGNFTITRKQ